NARSASTTARRGRTWTRSYACSARASPRRAGAGLDIVCRLYQTPELRPRVAAGDRSRYEGAVGVSFTSFSERIRKHPRIVSPNHILVPAGASDDHSCPYGPPSPTKRGSLLPVDKVTRRVVIVDCGYRWQMNWGLNPLRGTRFHHSHYLVDRGLTGPGS